MATYSTIEAARGDFPGTERLTYMNPEFSPPFFGRSFFFDRADILKGLRAFGEEKDGGVSIVPARLYLWRNCPVFGRG